MTPFTPRPLHVTTFTRPDGQPVSAGRVWCVNERREITLDQWLNACPCAHLAEQEVTA